MLSKADKQRLIDELSSSLGRAKLLCDGVTVDAHVQLDKMKLVVTVYINGKIEGKWIDGEDETVRKFWFKKEKFCYGKKARDFFLKGAKSRVMGKQYRAECAEKAAKRASFWLPYWSSPRSFINHICKTCQEIQIVSTGFVL